MYQADPGYHDGPEDRGYADDMPNVDAARPRNLDRSGVQHVFTLLHITDCLLCVLL